MTTEQLWTLIEHYRAGDVDRLRPILHRYDAETLSFELFGQDTETLQASVNRKPSVLARDWRDVAIARQNKRMAKRGLDVRLLNSHRQPRAGALARFRLDVFGGAA